MPQQEQTCLDEFINRREAAALLKVTPGTLAIWAFQKRGPVYRKMGRSVRYLRADILRFIEHTDRIATTEQE
ncbi:MAG: helix-turn-helix domain-containing protein [Tepidisphaeraceae bacterium]